MDYFNPVKFHGSVLFLLPSLEGMRILSILTAVLASLIGASSALALMSAPISIDTLMSRSAVVLSGAVVDQVEELNRCGKPVTRTIFEVEDGVKGAQVGDLVTLTQPGSLENHSLMGPHFAVSKRYLVFFSPNNQDCGTENPTGLDAGQFRIDVEGGEAVLQNGFGNEGLFAESDGHSEAMTRVRSRLNAREAAITAKNRGPLPLSDTLSLLHKWSGE